MSAITSSYERLIPSEQIATQASWRGWSLNLLKPQRDFFKGLGKLLGTQAIGFVTTELLSEISSQGDTARELNLHLTDTYYKTCTQAANAFLTAMVSTAIYSLCVYGYFIKKNQEKCNADMSSKMQVAIQHRVRDEIQAQLGRRTLSSR
ncbi:MAG TPA: hypothetical protein VGZ69_00010 [Candidatus Rhabdochlamydia sp.]|jgi:hypothetical protein|nr:hypothetical protein [Candidatus Rhabdochlamydia sp.]